MPLRRHFYPRFLQCSACIILHHFHTLYITWCMRDPWRDWTHDLGVANTLTNWATHDHFLSVSPVMPTEWNTKHSNNYRNFHPHFISIMLGSQLFRECLVGWMMMGCLALSLGPPIPWHQQTSYCVCKILLNSLVSWNTVTSRKLTTCYRKVEKSHVRNLLYFSKYSLTGLACFSPMNQRYD